jgi:hypothetical protein
MEVLRNVEGQQHNSSALLMQNPQFLHQVGSVEIPRLFNAQIRFIVPLRKAASPGSPNTGYSVRSDTLYVSTPVGFQASGAE